MTPRFRQRAALLAARRESLVALARDQRATVARRWRALEAPLQWIDRGWQAWIFVRAHAWAMLAPAAAVAVFRPRWIWRTVGAFVALARITGMARRRR